MTGIEETTILISDLENVHDVLSMMFTYLTASDVARAQLTCTTLKPSNLTNQVETAKERVDGIIGDWLFIQRREAREAGLTMEEGVEEIEEFEEEPLPAHPLGEFRAPHQVGRRLDEIKRPRLIDEIQEVD